MRELKDFYDTYQKYRARHELRLYSKCSCNTYKMLIKHYKTIDDVRIVCSITAETEADMYTRARKDLTDYFEGRRSK